MATVTKRGNTYRIRVSCGYDVAENQIIKSITWKPAPELTKKQIEKELERQKVMFEEKCRTGRFLDGSIKFADFVDKWMSDYAEKQLKEKTLARYRNLLKRILPAIGHIRLEQLQPHHLMRFYDNLEESGIRADVKYKCRIDFKDFLQKNGYSRVHIAQISGVSAATVSSLGMGRNVSRTSAERVSAALNRPFSELFEQVGGEQGLSGKTILHHHRLISSVLTTAVQWQVIFSNPCDRVKPPKAEQKEARYLDEKASH